MLSELTDHSNFPTPIGILYKEDKPTYESMLVDQIDNAISKKPGNIQDLIQNANTWNVD